MSDSESDTDANAEKVVKTSSGRISRPTAKVKSGAKASTTADDDEEEPAKTKKKAKAKAAPDGKKKKAKCDDFVLTSWFSDLTGGSASGVSRCSAFTGLSDLRRRSDNVHVSLRGFYPLSVSFIASMLLSRLGPCGLSRTCLCRASLLPCTVDIRQRNEEVCSSFRLLSSPFHSPLRPQYIVLVPFLVERLAALAPSPVELLTLGGIPSSATRSLVYAKDPHQDIPQHC